MGNDYARYVLKGFQRTYGLRELNPILKVENKKHSEEKIMLKTELKIEPWFYRYNGWSYTKHRSYGLCKRMYWYANVAPATGGFPGSIATAAKLLKGLTSKYAIRGLLVHQVIENQLGQSLLGREMSFKSALNQFTMQMDKYRDMASEMITEAR